VLLTKPLLPLQLLRFVFEAAFRSGLGPAAEGGARDWAPPGGVQVWLRDVEVCTDLQAACARASCLGAFSVSSDSHCASHLSECGLVRGDAGAAGGAEGGAERRAAGSLPEETLAGDGENLMGNVGGHVADEATAATPRERETHTAATPQLRQSVTLPDLAPPFLTVPQLTAYTPPTATECVTGYVPRDLLPAGSGRTCVRELLLDMVGEAVVVLCSGLSAGTRWRELPLN
jgi:hypothetical protein